MSVWIVSCPVNGGFITSLVSDFTEIALVRITLLLDHSQTN